MIDASNNVVCDKAEVHAVDGDNERRLGNSSNLALFGRNKKKDTLK